MRVVRVEERHLDFSMLPANRGKYITLNPINACNQYMIIKVKNKNV